MCEREEERDIERRGKKKVERRMKTKRLIAIDSESKMKPFTANIFMQYYYRILFAIMIYKPIKSFTNTLLRKTLGEEKL